MFFSNFAVEHDIFFYFAKSQVMFLKDMNLLLTINVFLLSNMALLYTSQYKYLMGHLLTNELRNDNDIIKQYLPELICLFEGFAQHNCIPEYCCAMIFVVLYVTVNCGAIFV